jgi:hypothetical protein
MSLFDSASICITPNGVKEGKLYSIKPTDGSGDLVVTRSTTATRVNSDGLIEVVPRNLLTYSEQFDNAAWRLVGTTITANSIVAPDGNLTGDIINYSTNGTVQIPAGVTVPQSTTSTISVYAKANSGTVLRIRESQYVGTNTIFNLQTGVVQSGSGVIIPVGNGWYRCSLSFSYGVGQTIASFIFDLNAEAGSIFLWGAQLNTGTSAKDYYPTTTRLNIPRLDYTNGSCPSILVEPQRTNLLLQSNVFNSVSWSKYGTPVINSGILSPDGTNNAFELNMSVGQGVYQNATNTAGTYACSIYIKGDTNGIIGLIDGNSLPTQTVNVTTEWKRVNVVLTKGVSPLQYAIYRLDSSYLSKVYIYGAQCELGSYPTSYIPTTSASVTRNADVISKTGISSLIGQTEGTVLIDINYKVINETSMFFSVRPSTSNKIEIYRDSQTIYGEIVGNSVSISLSKSSSPSGTYKIALAYKSGETVLYVNGTNVGTSTTAFSFSTSMADLFLGSRSGGTLIEQGFFNQATIWKERLTNDQLAQLTTI